MEHSFLNKILERHISCDVCPNIEEVESFFINLMGLFYPDHAPAKLSTWQDINSVIEKLKNQLHDLLSRSLCSTINDQASELCHAFFDQIEEIHDNLSLDIDAIYEGDPACKSRREVIRSYPGFYAIAAYRVAHALYTLNVPDLPRIITERAHNKTGIDIHPGATIGQSFCIDHGTGVVIGETTVIHNHVKIYQGVTLGALSVSKSDANQKRHPTIEDHCVIYAGATILGGQTHIGAHSVIGGNVWLTQSLPPHSKIYYQAKMSSNTDDQYDLLVYKEYAK